MLFSLRRCFSSVPLNYDRVSHATLEAMSEYLEGLSSNSMLEAELANGVLTLKLPSIGTYVINRQPPNRQLWLSSPLSGPKRFKLNEIIPDLGIGWSGRWVCERQPGLTLKALLDEELTTALHTQINLP